MGGTEGLRTHLVLRHERSALSTGVRLGTRQEPSGLCLFLPSDAEATGASQHKDVGKPHLAQSHCFNRF